MLSWSEDYTLRLWDGQTGLSLAVLEGHTRSIRAVHVLADGRVLSWSSDNTLRLWNGQTGAPLAVCANPADWQFDINVSLALITPQGRAQHHSLHLGFSVSDARDGLAVFIAERYLRFCRFTPAPLESQ